MLLLLCNTYQTSALVLTFLLPSVSKHNSSMPVFASLEWMEPVRMLSAAIRTALTAGEMYVFFIMIAVCLIGLWNGNVLASVADNDALVALVHTLSAHIVGFILIVIGCAVDRFDAERVVDIDG